MAPVDSLGNNCFFRFFRLVAGGLIQAHAVLGGDPGRGGKRIGPLSLELAGICKLKKIAEPRAFLFCKGFGNGLSPLVCLLKSV